MECDQEDTEMLGEGGGPELEKKREIGSDRLDGIEPKCKQAEAQESKPSSAAWLT